MVLDVQAARKGPALGERPDTGKLVIQEKKAKADAAIA
jgi:hypothetical protein